MFMRFAGMGIGHQNGSANAGISDDMDCDPDACEESEDYGDDEIRRGGSEDMNEDEDEDDIEDEGEEESEDDEEEDGEEDQDDDQYSEDDIGYDDL
jgi:hypothetical protein